VRAVLREGRVPVVGRLQRLVSTVEVGGLAGPVDGEVYLADLLKRLGGVLQPGCDLPVARMGADDRVDVVVEDGEALVVPLDGEPLMRVR